MRREAKISYFSIALGNCAGISEA